MAYARFVAIKKRRIRPDRLHHVRVNIYLMLLEAPGGMTAYRIARKLCFDRASYAARNGVLSHIAKLEELGLVGRYYGTEDSSRTPVKRRPKFVKRSTHHADSSLDPPDQWMLDQLERKRARDRMRAVA